MSNTVEFEAEIGHFDYADLGVLRGMGLALHENPNGSLDVGKRYLVTLEEIEPEPKQEEPLGDKMEFDAEVFDAGPRTAYNHPGVVVLAMSRHDPDLGALEKLKGHYRVTLEPLVPELRACMCGGHPEHDLSIYRVRSYLSDDLVVTERDDSAENFQVWCGQCSCRGPIAPSEHEAAERWNRWWAV